MKNLIPALLILCALRGMAQFPKTINNKYEPRQVQETIYGFVDTAGIQKIIVYENYRYTYVIKRDTLPGDSVIFASWELIKKEKLFYRPYTAMGVTAFSVGMGSILTFTSIDLPTDKKLHALAGFYIGGGASAWLYKKTGRKWLSCLGGGLFGTVVGGAKELIDPSIGGVRSLKDFLVTGSFSFAGALTVRIILK